MCPQGLTFAENYLLISAYDTYNEENSVIYVMDKTSKELLTVIVLPNKTHAGGITYDGENIWITNGQKICTIDFNEVDVAAQENNIFKNVNFTGTYNLGHKASFLAWHKTRYGQATLNIPRMVNLEAILLQKQLAADKIQQNLVMKQMPGIQ